MNAITTNYRLISNCAILDQTVHETIFCTSSSKILYSSDKKNAIPVIRRKLFSGNICKLAVLKLNSPYITHNYQV